MSNEGKISATCDLPSHFEKVKGSGFKVAGNLCSTRELIAGALGLEKGEIVRSMLKAIENPSEPAQFDGNAPCQEEVMEGVDLGKLPILTHCEKDGGPYVSSGVFFAVDKEYGRNCSYHRGMVIGSDRLVLRILPRHLNEFIKND